MVDVMGQKMCIINSYEVANDLLNDRSLIYSDRPAMPMVNDLHVELTIFSLYLFSFEFLILFSMDWVRLILPKDSFR
jgi:hypothetical protein